MPPKQKVCLPRGQTTCSFAPAAALPHPLPLTATALPAAGTPLATGSGQGEEDDEEEEEQQQGPQSRTVLYQKQSDNARAVREDPIESFRTFLQHLHQGHVDWQHLTPGDLRLKKKFDNLSESQRRVYYTLVRLLQAYVQNSFGIDGFDDCSRQWVWNWPTWHRTITRLSESIDNQVRGESECWLSSLSTDKGGRPKIPVRPGQCERRPDGNHSRRNFFDFYQIEGSSGRLETTAARVAVVLRLGVPADSSLQASHLCHNFPQTCINLYHLVWESDRINKSRNLCVMSNAVSCFHTVKCVFTGVDGRWLPHRNLDFRATPCDCTVDCLEALTVEVDIDDE